MTHDERVHHHLYVESKSPLENAERIASLEELMEELQAENEKLRELLRDVHALGWSGFDCTECPVSFISRCNDEYSGCEWVTILADRMRELGVDE